MQCFFTAACCGAGCHWVARVGKRSAHAVPLIRQALEQYFTEAQVRAHLRRQVIGRPQTRQGLLGRWDLLPGKFMRAWIGCARGSSLASLGFGRKQSLSESLHCRRILDVFVMLMA